MDYRCKGAKSSVEIDLEDVNETRNEKVNILDNISTFNVSCIV